MSVENEVVDEEVTEEEVVEEVVEDEEIESQAETDARVQGWVPEDEFRGDPSIWRSAEEFLEVGEKQAAVGRERNKKLTSEISSLKEKMSELVKHGKDQKDLAVKRAIKEMKAERDEAILESDVDRVREIDDEIEAYKKDSEEKKEPELSAEFVTWKEDKDWYNDDEFLRAEAHTGMGLNPSHFKTETAFYNAIEKKLRKQYPDDFEETPVANPRKTKQSPVATPKKTSTTKPKGKTFADLPADAKRVYETFKEVMPDFTQEQYVSEYEWEE